MGKIFFTVIITVLCFALVFYMLKGLEMHEKVHYKVCEAMNGIPEYNFTTSKFTTICYFTENTTQELYDRYHPVDLINEAVGYNLYTTNSILFVTFILLLIICVQNELRRLEEKRYFYRHYKR